MQVIHYERGARSGLPAWNPLAYAACGAELLSEDGLDRARYTRDTCEVTCPACKLPAAWQAAEEAARYFQSRVEGQNSFTWTLLSVNSGQELPPSPDSTSHWHWLKENGIKPW